MQIVNMHELNRRVYIAYYLLLLLHKLLVRRLSITNLHNMAIDKCGNVELTTSKLNKNSCTITHVKLIFCGVIYSLQNGNDFF